MKEDQVCKHHEAHEVRLDYLERSMRKITGMFVTIILALLLILGQRYLPDLTPAQSMEVHGNDTTSND